MIASIDVLSQKILQLARQTVDAKEVPVASMVCDSVEETNLKTDISNQGLIQGSTVQSIQEKKYRVLSTATNRICNQKDPTAHSEIIALRKACRKKKRERLEKSILITTLEPCLMCSGAIILSRLHSVYYFTAAHKGPAMSWLLKKMSKENSNDNCPKLNHYPVLIHLHSQEKEYQKILRGFFQQRR